MAGVTTIIAVVALLVGIAAIWLVTEAISKIEKRMQKSVEVQIRGLRNSVKDLSESVNNLKTGQETVVNRVRDVVRNRETADTELASMRRDLDAMTGTVASAGNKSRSQSG